MESEILKLIGQIVGLGGIGIGLLIIVFRDLLRKTIFPNLRKTHAFYLLTTIVVASWSVAIAGIGAWVYTVEPFSIMIGDNRPKIDITTKIISDWNGFFLLKNKTDGLIYTFQAAPLIIKISNLTEFPLIIDDIILRLERIDYDQYDRSEWTSEYIYHGGAEVSYNLLEIDLNDEDFRETKEISLLSHKQIKELSAYRKITYSIPPYQAELVPFVLHINAYPDNDFFNEDQDIVGIKLDFNIVYTVKGKESFVTITNTPNILVSQWTEGEAPLSELLHSSDIDGNSGIQSLDYFKFYSEWQKQFQNESFVEE